MSKLIGAVLLVLPGCAAAPSPAAGVPEGSPPSAGSCALDASWLASTFGEYPTNSEVKRFDRMRENSAFAPAIAREEADSGTFGTGLNRFEGISARVEEKYEWWGTRATEFGVVVLREVSGRSPTELDDFALRGKDARSFGSLGRPAKLYAEPVRLASGVLEHAAHAEYLASDPRGGHTLFVFPDRTWVDVPDWMAPRLRSSFSANASSPPPPAVERSVAWEFCFRPRLDDPTPAALANNGASWADELRGHDRVALRYFAGRGMDADIVFRFPDAAEARRAERETALRCASAPCGGLLGSAVDGSALRFKALVRL